MSVGKNIFELRKAKKLTQAELAEKLGVSDQAVSKWENDICVPDVTLFPIIADFFGVSIDRLYGFHLNSYSVEVEKILKKADDSMDTYKEIEVISEGLERYPNSPDLKISLAFSLSMVNRISNDEDERKKAVSKAIKLCQEVVDICGDRSQVDRALNMLRRIYCEIGEYQKAFDAINKISADGYRQRIIGQAQILALKKDDEEHSKFTEKSLFDCFLTMNGLFELKRVTLLERKEYDKVLWWCSAQEKLLSVFDDGCTDFYVSHKLRVYETQAQVYKKLGDKQKCLEKLRKMASLSGYIQASAKGEDYRISARNPMYFSHFTDPDAVEEFINALHLDTLLAGYDSFFGDHEDYQKFKKMLHQ